MKLFCWVSDAVYDGSTSAVNEVLCQMRLEIAIVPVGNCASGIGMNLVDSLSANFTKWSNTQTIRRQFADELFECV